MFTYIAAPWYGQKIFAAASEKTAFYSRWNFKYNYIYTLFFSLLWHLPIYE